MSEMELQFPLHNDTSRKIIHIDMDAFFASVEERDHPEFRGKPLVIARHPSDTGGRGVVTTANYEARKYGIHSAMSAQKHMNYVRKPFLNQAIIKNIVRSHKLFVRFFTDIRISLSLSVLMKPILM